MQKDPIVEEVRKAGARIAEKCGFDADILISRLIRNQKKSGRKIVSYAKRSYRKTSIHISPSDVPAALQCAEDRLPYKTGRK